VRIRSILNAIQPTGLFEPVAPNSYPESVLYAVHDPKYVAYFKKVCSTIELNRSIYPYVFPVRNAARPPTELAVRAGYYCIDTFTPINRNAFTAATGAVSCALTAADLVLAGFRVAYALVRPPGHHAERSLFGGFCFFNINYPLPETIAAEKHLDTARKALAHIKAFAPAHLVVCLGLDTAKGDPTGTWPLRGKDFHELGRLVGGVSQPIVIVQEGGYDNRSLGGNARQFLSGVWEAKFAEGTPPKSMGVESKVKNDLLQRCEDVGKGGE
jgi:acetoin utilization deacetylase AcuC-like enzyme